MPVAELPGVSMWYDERGQGAPCVLLHPGGAGVDSRDPTLDGLARVFRCYTPEQRAHGRTADAGGPISYELMAGDTTYRRPLRVMWTRRPSPGGGRRRLPPG